LVTGFANGFSIPRGKLSVFEGFHACAAKEVFRVIRLVEKFDGIFKDRFFAMRTIVTKELDVVCLTIRQSIVFVIVRLHKRNTTNMARKVIRMPHFPDGCDGTPLARLTASCTFFQQ